jgi:dTDP-4-dehydrorhamnose reductase
MHQKKKSFPLFVLEILKSGEEIKALSDQFTSPTYGMNLGVMLKEIIDRRIRGIIHTSGCKNSSVLQIE